MSTPQPTSPTAHPTPPDSRRVAAGGVITEHAQFCNVICPQQGRGDDETPTPLTTATIALFAGDVAAQHHDLLLLADVCLRAFH